MYYNIYSLYYIIYIYRPILFIIVYLLQFLPVLKVDATNLPAHLQKGIALFEKAMVEIQFMVENGDRLVAQIRSKLDGLLEFYEDLQNLASQGGIKGKKYNRVHENYTWNVRILRGQIDLLESSKKDCKLGISQVKKL